MTSADHTVQLGDGTRGEHLKVPSASPGNFHQAISEPESMPEVAVDATLFVPPGGAQPCPLVMIVPGSLGIAPSHVAHAETLYREGFATCVLDSFRARQVESTVADQTQFSFAASAYDVLAAYRVLAPRPEIDAARIGAQGHSRGGSAVLTAATRCFADAVVGRGQGLAAVFAAYPWSGQQFLTAAVGDTEVWIAMGDADEWCSPTQVQAHCHAMRLAGGRASMRLVGGAQHSFDRDTPIENVAEARVAPGAPITYIADDGAMVHPLSGRPDPELVDRDVMVYAMKAGFGKRGARIGSRPGDAALFREEMVGFWTRVMR